MENRIFRLVIPVLLAVCLALFMGSSPATAAGEVALTLSWSADQKVSTLDWPGAEGAVEITRTLYATLDATTPVDSLGLFLRWATHEAGGRVRFHGMAGSDGQPLNCEEHGKPASEGSFRPLDSWLGDPGFLRQIESGNADQGYRYCFSTRITLSGAKTVKLLASGLIVKTADGAYYKPGEATASIGEGWALEMPPLVTEIRGILNRRALKSRLTLVGEDLNRLVRIALIDSTGSRVLPVQLTFSTRERIDMIFTTKSVIAGHCQMEIGAPSSWIGRFEGAVEASHLDQLQPFDEKANRGEIYE